MIFGFNTDVIGKDAVYHVQTEDRGTKNPVIDSIIYVGGKIVDRRRTSYKPPEVTPGQIEDMVRHQHRELVEAIRAGTFVRSGAAHAAPPAPAAAGYAIQLQNRADLVRQDQLCFELSVSEKAHDSPAQDVSLEVRWALAGAASEKRVVQSQANGTAVVCFPLPGEPAEAVLWVRARGPQGRELVKFRVRGIVAPA